MIEKVTLPINYHGQQIMTDLVPTYKKIFEFVNNPNNASFAKDLVQVITTKRAMDYESIVQFIYVSYLGGNNPEPFLTYSEFLDAMGKPDFKRDMKIFAKLTGNENQIEVLEKN